MTDYGEGSFGLPPLDLLHRPALGELVDQLVEPADLLLDRVGDVLDAIAADRARDLRRVGIRTALGGSFVVKVPAIAASNWSLTLPEPAVFFDVAGTQGATEPSDDRRSFNVDAGSSTAIDVRWSQNPPEPRPVRIEASQPQILDLRSTHGELRFRVRCDPLESQFDFLEFDLPAKGLVREGDIRAANLLRAEVLPGPRDT